MPPAAIIGGAILGAGALSAREQRKAVTQAADAQVGAGREAISFGADQVAPFRNIGVTGTEALEGEFLPAGSGPTFEGFDTNPSRVLNNPLFTALAKDQEQRLINQNASLGRAGSGGTNDQLTRNLLLLGNQFQQQDIGNQQQEFQNRLALNQNRFGQLFDVSRLGANAATQQATTGANIIQGIGNARSAEAIARGNAATNFIGQIGGGITGAVIGGSGGFGPNIGAGGGALLGFTG